MVGPHRFQSCHLRLRARRPVGDSNGKSRFIGWRYGHDGITGSAVEDLQIQPLYLQKIFGGTTEHGAAQAAPVARPRGPYKHKGLVSLRLHVLCIQWQAELKLLQFVMYCRPDSCHGRVAGQEVSRIMPQTLSQTLTQYPDGRGGANIPDDSPHATAATSPLASSWNEISICKSTAWLPHVLIGNPRPLRSAMMAIRAAPACSAAMPIAAKRMCPNTQATCAISASLVVHPAWEALFKESAPSAEKVKKRRTVRICCGTMGGS